MNVLVCPDKFKGTLTAHAAAWIIADAWTSVRPDDHLDMVPMTDGGDGFGEVMASVLHASAISAAAMNAAHQAIEATWWYNSTNRLAIIETARAVGLAMLAQGRFHPLDLDSAGVATMLEQALNHGAERLLIGVGGTATNDGGFGMGRALGWRFLEASGRALERWTELQGLAHVEPPPTPFRPTAVVAVDVQNPLLGGRGATRAYGPQKGLRESELATAERCLARLAEVVEREITQQATANEPGAGAGGGLGFGLRSFLGARLESGFLLFAQHARLDQRIADADLVITGEGAIDASSLMGKGVGELASLCARRGVPCLGLAGSASKFPIESSGLFAGLHAIVPNLATHQEALANPTDWLRHLAISAARTYQS